MNDYDKTRLEARNELVDSIEKMGYPKVFGELIADSLGSEKAMTRMTAYLFSAHPQSAEEIADEMLAIQSDNKRWRDKKLSEYYNGRYNEYLYENRQHDSESYPIIDG